MQPFIALIGLDPSTEGAVGAVLTKRTVRYPSPPALYSLNGVVHIASITTQGKWIQPDGVIYYGYFPDASAERKALALSDTPTFPDVRRTILHDDKALSLMLSMAADPCPVAVPRGFIPNLTVQDVPEEMVFKWGNAHCGHNKARGVTVPAHSSIVEPFITGLSDRILIVGRKAWHLRYHSEDWRKNIRGTVEEVAPADWALIERSIVITENLKLEVAGVDYVRPASGEPPVLLEVNAYPELSQAPGAEEAFAALAREWEP